MSSPRGRLALALMWSSAGVLGFGWYVLRSAGFTSSYSRCQHLIGQSEYMQLLEPGASPANPYLPPHLRLDQLSYLDLPSTELAVPPLVDLSLSDAQRMTTLASVHNELDAERRERRASGATTTADDDKGEQQRQQSPIAALVAWMNGTTRLGWLEVGAAALDGNEHERVFTRRLPMRPASAVTKEA